MMFYCLFVFEEIFWHRTLYSGATKICKIDLTILLINEVKEGKIVT